MFFWFDSPLCMHSPQSTPFCIEILKVAQNNLNTIFSNISITMLSRRIARSFTSQHMKNIRLTGIQSRNLIFNPTVSELYEIAFLREKPADPYTKPTFVSNDGALCADSGVHKTRNQKQERVVKDAITEKAVQWEGSKNVPLKKESFRLVEQFAIDYLNHKKRCIVVDGYIGWNPAYRLKVRTFCARSYHALFMHNLLVRPTEKELQEDFTKGVDVHVFNAGEMAVSRSIEGLGNTAVTGLDLQEKKLAIMGTQFAGEMKKALFKIVHYTLPRDGTLTMRASATIGPDGKVAVICGRSATGKSALFMDNDRKIISDDELVWGEDGVAGLEGGCYPKILGHNAQESSYIDDAIRYGTLLENVNFKPGTRDVNYNDSSSTHNLRASFPLHFLPNAAIPPVGKHPEHVILLTCDQTGVLPLVAKLNPEQAAYYFLMGYTTTLSDPQKLEPTFSACFGESSLPLSPTVYTRLFYEKIKKHGTKVWLINSGWTKSKAGSKRIISFKQIETAVDSIIGGKLNDVDTAPLPHFELQVPKAIQGVADDLLHPGWGSKIEYSEELAVLAIKFKENYEKKYKGKMEKIQDNITKAMPHAP